MSSKDDFLKQVQRHRLAKPKSGRKTKEKCEVVPIRPMKVNSLDDLPKLYSINEVADQLSVSYQTVWRAISAGKLRAIPISGVWKVPAQAVADYLHEQSKRQSAK